MNGGTAESEDQTVNRTTPGGARGAPSEQGGSNAAQGEEEERRRGGTGNACAEPNFAEKNVAEGGLIHRGAQGEVRRPKGKASWLRWELQFPAACRVRYRRQSRFMQLYLFPRLPPSQSRARDGACCNTMFEESVSDSVKPSPRPNRHRVTTTNNRNRVLHLIEEHVVVSK